MTKWIEELKNGKFKFAERYTDYLTGRSKKVSVALDKNTAQNRKLMYIIEVRLQADSEKISLVLH